MLSLRCVVSTADSQSARWAKIKMNERFVVTTADAESAVRGVDCGFSVCKMGKRKKMDKRLEVTTADDQEAATIV